MASARPVSSGSIGSCTAGGSTNVAPTRLPERATCPRRNRARSVSLPTRTGILGLQPGYGSIANLSRHQTVAVSLLCRRFRSAAAGTSPW